MMMHRYLPTHHLRQTSGDHITLIPFTQADIRHVMPENAFKIGFTYWLQGNILDLNAKTDRKGIDLLTAKVRGAKHNSYLVDIKVNLDMQGQIHFESHCTCGSGDVHCAHVAAVLFYTLNQGNQLYSQAVDTHIEKVADIVSDRKTVTKPKHTIHSQPHVLDPPLSPVDHSLTLWLEKLSQAALEISPPNTYPAQVKQRVLYLLDLKKKGEKPYLQLEVVSARQLKDGGYGKLYHLRTTTADYVLPIDRSLLKWLEPLKINRSYQTSYQLQGIEGVEFLQRILATGRCYWKDKDSPALQLGPMRTAHPVWQVTPDGTQYLIYQVEGGANAILPLCPPWYINSNNNRCGPLETGLPYSIASALLEAPPLKPLQVEVVRQKLAKQAPHLPQPHRFQQIRHKQIQPIIRLSLFNKVFQVARQYRWECHTDEITIPMARLTFIYEEIEINAYTQSALTLSYFDNSLNELIQIERDLTLEKQAQNRLQKLGFESLKSHYFYKYLKVPEENQADLFLLLHTDPAATEQALLNFSLDKVPQLQNSGWQITMDPSYSFRVVEPRLIEEWYAEIDDKSGIDWFGLELGIKVANQRINLLPLLVQLLREIEHFHGFASLAPLSVDTLLMPRLEDGRILPLRVEQVQNILNVLIELFDKNPLDQRGRLRLVPMHATQLIELESAMGTTMPLQWQGGEKLRELGHKLNHFNEIKFITVPSHFHTQLRTYQHEGLNWLQFLREYGLAGILADDMGLGKTIQTLAHILTEKHHGRLTRPTLVVTPTSLITNWQREAQRFAPDLQVLALQGPKRKQWFEQIGDYDLVLTTYSLLHRDKIALLDHQYHLLVLDEAQNIKNPLAQVTQIAHQISAKHRLCLTGTPLENNLKELWSLFHFLTPGLLGDYRRFHRLFRVPIEQENNLERRTALSQRIKPFLLRRTKAAVIKELPQKNEIIRIVELEGAQRDLYETIRLTLHDKISKEIAKKGIAQSQIIILDALLKLRQVCCDPRLLKLESTQHIKQSAKLRLLMDLVPEMIAEGRRILLFSQFTSMLNLIETELKKHKLTYVKLIGRTQNRTQVIDRFQSGIVPIFLISLKAGGTGLNLTTADTVIHYDPWWNPALETQATDRTHRIGQDKHVFVYKLLTAGTVEEKIQELQLRKQQLADMLFTGENQSKMQLSPEDLEILFEPL